MAATSAIVLAGGVGACGGRPGATLTTASPTTGGSPAASPSSTAGAGAPSVVITRPSDGSTVPPGDLQVQVNVVGTSLVDKTGSPPVPGEGHLLYYLGVDFVPTAPGRPAYTAPGTYAASSASAYTFPALSTGRYVVAVQVVNNDDTPLVPPVTARATVSVLGAVTSAPPSTPPPPGGASSGQRGSPSQPGAAESQAAGSDP